MRKLIIIGCLLVAGVVAMGLPRQAFQTQWMAATSGGGGTDITAGLLHFWNPGGALSELDQVGSNDGNLQGGLTNGVTGWEMGTDDAKYVNLDATIANGTNYSIALWAKPDVTAMKLNGSGGWLVTDRNTVSSQDDFQIIFGKTKIALVVWDSSDATASVAQTNDTANNVWVHIIVVCDADNDELRMYENGSLVSTVSLGIVPNDACPLAARIGQASWGTSQHQKYHGVMDKIRFYSAAVDDTFALAIYDDEKASKGL